MREIPITAPKRAAKPSEVSKMAVCPKCCLVIPLYYYIEHVKECEGGKESGDDDEKTA